MPNYRGCTICKDPDRFSAQYLNDRICHDCWKWAVDIIGRAWLPDPTKE